MGYHLQGVIALKPTLAPAQAFRHARIVDLEQGFGLLLVTQEFFDEVRREGAEEPLRGVFWFLPPGLERLLVAWSKAGPVAYMEADCVGGEGSQAAAVWVDGELRLGPLTALGVPRRPPVSPISRALREMGASAEGSGDEFRAVGLDRHRHMEDWFDETL